MNKRTKFFYFILIMNIFCVCKIFSTITLVSAWGDNSNLPDMRPSYTKAEIDAGKLGDNITFNSISDNTALGEGENADEKGFVDAREHNDTDASHLWHGRDITVEDGKEYVVRMYVHNNSPKAYAGVAENTRVFFNVPSESAKSVRVTGFLTSSNATPTEYWDHVNFNSDTAFHLEFVDKSAKISNKGIGKNGGAALSNEIVTNTQGVLIGYDALDGKIPGCFNYSSIVTIRVRVVYDTEFTVSTKVRLSEGEDRTWKKSIDAEIHNKVDFLIKYTNTSDEWQNDVIVRDILPSNLKYIPGSTFIKNGAHPDGAVFNEDDIIGTGIYIGSYAPKASALIRFQAEVVDDTFTCGKFVLNNWGRATVGNKLIQDSAAVNVQLAYCPKFNFVLYLSIVLVIISLISFSFFTYKLWRYKKMK